MVLVASRPLAGLVVLGLAARVAAAWVVERVAERGPGLCLFPDTEIYWSLAQAVRRGGPYVVNQYEVPHFALRAPGYPLFLALSQWAFGESPLAARLVQAVLGAMSVVLVYTLVERLAPKPDEVRRWSPGLLAAAFAAIDPWTVVLSALLLSEAVFVPLMLLGLWGMAVLWSGPPPKHPRWVAWGAGLAWGAAALVKPSWMLFPVAIGLIGFAIEPGLRAGRAAVFIALGVAIAMGPWWARNGSVLGRFVPTALWLGASLHDGLGPGATGASDMRFLDAPDLRALSEVEQDAELRRRAWAFVRERPARVIELAAIKFGRYWSPWPNAASVRSPLATVVGALVTVPVFVLVALGAWRVRHDARSLALLAGPVLYFMAIHLVFVSSVRYRLPGMVPAFGLAGLGVDWVGRLARRRRVREGRLGAA